MAKRNFVGAKGAKILRRVARHILAEPRRYEQNGIVQVGTPGAVYKGKHKFPACVTVACIGGWIQTLYIPRGDWGAHGVGIGLNHHKIAELLGVPVNSELKLVSYTNLGMYSIWPQKYRAAYNKAKTPRQKARIAVERIEFFIKTGE